MHYNHTNSSKALSGPARGDWKWQWKREGKKEGKHGRKEILGLQSIQIVKRRRKLRRRQIHLGIFVNLPPHHHGEKCHPNLIKWDPNQIKKRKKVTVL
jgi:hypothetical protein